jgi:hypothetical protein
MGVRRYNGLDLLHPDFRGLVVLFLARTIERRIPIVIVETWRTEEAHQEDVRNGRSWVKTSKHQHIVTRSFGGFTIKDPASLAIDVAPYEEYRLYGDDKLQWNAGDPVWQDLGELGEHCGMKWGGRWKKKDMAHFQAPWA